MKIAKFFAWIFGILGAVLMAGSIVLCLTSLNKEAQLKEVPEEALACAEAVMEAIQAGDYTAASQRMYGRPDLGVNRTPEETAGIIIWDAFLASIEYEFKGDYYATDSGIAVKAAITSLDIPSVTAALTQKAHGLLTERVESATDMDELYDEENNFREDLVSQVLTEAIVRVLAEDAQKVTRDVTLTLLYREGQWWVQPDAALLTAITGGVA